MVSKVVTICHFFFCLKLQYLKSIKPPGWFGKSFSFDMKYSTQKKDRKRKSWKILYLKSAKLNLFCLGELTIDPKVPPTNRQHLQSIQTVVQEFIAGHEKVHRLPRVPRCRKCVTPCDTGILQMMCVSSFTL